MSQHDRSYSRMGLDSIGNASAAKALDIATAVIEMATLQCHLRIHSEDLQTDNLVEFARLIVPPYF